MKFEIKNRFTGTVQFTCELDAEYETKEYRFQLGFAVKAAIKVRADLSRADLSDADLSRADLSDADLSGAYLSRADLSGAYLSRADLSDADLSDADLSGAYLSRADLSDADLSGANLSRANLSLIKKDFFERLILAKNEVSGLYDHLMRGKIDGSCYEGECACFCGTVANIRKENFRELTNKLSPDSDSPTERWFRAIRKGDSPDNNQVAAITARWIKEFMEKEGLV